MGCRFRSQKAKYTYGTLVPAQSNFHIDLLIRRAKQRHDRISAKEEQVGKLIVEIVKNFPRRQNHFFEGRQQSLQRFFGQSSEQLVFSDFAQIVHVRTSLSSCCALITPDEAAFQGM